MSFGMKKKKKHYFKYFHFIMFYKVEIIEPKNPLAQLKASESSVEDLLKDHSNEMKGFKYQITVIVLLCKHKMNEDIEYAPAQVCN